MNIIILGAGTVGVNIADYLCLEGHDVTIVDQSKSALREASDLLDAAALLGHAADHAVLRRAGVGEAHLVLAMTNLDEVNLMAAFTAKQLGAKRTVARVRNRMYVDQADLNFSALLNIDLLLSPEVLAAQEIVKFVDNPAALAMQTYARGRVEMRRFEVEKDSEVAGRVLSTVKLPQGTLIVEIKRGDEIIIPSGSATLDVDDRVAVIGLPRQIQEVQRLFSPGAEAAGTPQDVVIVGGGETGHFLAETLEQRDHRVKLIDSDRERCEYLSERLERTTVIHGDVRHVPFLKEERVGTADVFVATTGDDETNVMSSLLAKELGARKTCCLVSRPDYLPVVEKAGVDLAVSPRMVTANKVLALVKRGAIRSVSILEEGKAEIVEFQAMKGSAVVNKALKDIQLPAGCLVATIVHRGQVLVPRGGSIIRVGDIVIAAGLSDSIDALETLFSGGDDQTETT